MDTFSNLRIPVIESLFSLFQDWKHPDRPCAPIAVNQIAHKSNDRLDHDVEMYAKHKVPEIITSLGARVQVNDAIDSYGRISVAKYVDRLAEDYTAACEKLLSRKSSGHYFTIFGRQVTC